MDWFDNTVLIGATVSALALIGLITWRLTQRYKGASIGEIINIQLVKEKITFFIGGALLANIAEAAMAASIHPPGEMDPNPITRWLIHMTVGVAGIVCGVYSFHYVRQFAARKKKTKNSYILASIIIGMLVLGSIGFPYLNLVIIAKGTGDLQLLLGFWRDPIVALDRMTFVTAGSFVAMLAHLGLVTLDGLLTADDIKFVAHVESTGKSGDKKDVNKNINDRAEKNRTDKLDNVKDAIKFLLRRYGYKSTGNAKSKKDYTDVLEDAQKKLDGMSTNDQYTLAENLWRLVEDIKHFDSHKKGKSKDEVKKANEEFNDRIYALWESSTKGGKGFGRKLFSRGN